MWKDSIRNIVVIFQTDILRTVGFYVRRSAIVFEIPKMCKFIKLLFLLCLKLVCCWSKSIKHDVSVPQSATPLCVCRAAGIGTWGMVPTNLCQISLPYSNWGKRGKPDRLIPPIFLTFRHLWYIGTYCRFLWENKGKMIQKRIVAE